MATKSPTGGSNRVAVWGYSAGGVTGITGITSEYFLFDKNETTTITGDVRVDQVELELANKIRNTDFVKFKDAVLTRVNIQTNTITYEDGSEDVLINIPSTAKKLVVVHVDGELSGDRIVTAFVGLMDSSAVGSSRSSGSLGDSNVKFVAIGAPEETTIGAINLYAALSDVLATGFTDLVIPANAYGVETTFTAA